MKAPTIIRRLLRAVPVLVAAAFSLAATSARGNTDPEAVNDTYHASALWLSDGLNVLANDHDADGNGLLIVAVTNGAKGTTSIANGRVYYSPGTGFDGNDSFTYTIDDGYGGQATATVTLTNTNPVAVNDTYHASAVMGPYGLDVRVNDSDPDGDPLEVVAVSNGTKGTTEVSPGGAIHYMPGPGFDGNDTFTYTIDDGLGGQATGTVTLTNTNPVTVNDTYHASAVMGPYGLDVRVNDSDPDGDWVWVVASTNGTKGTTEVSPGGTIHYMPGPGFDGSDTFTYTIDDGLGGRAIGTVTLTNTNPVAVNDTYHASAVMGPSGLDVRINDSDPDGDWVWVVAASNGAKGTTNVSGSGVINYMPGPGFDGNDTFTYTIDDGLGGRATGTVTLTNTNPVAVSDTYHASAVMGPLGLNVRMNDSDPDGDWVWVVASTNGAKGTTNVSGSGVINYMPGPGFDGNDTFTYTIDDGLGGRATGTVTLTNTNPVAVNDTYHALAVMGPSGLDVRINDTDPDGDWVWVVSTTNGQKGTASVNAYGTVNYFPGQNFDGNDTFTYTVDDGLGGRATATVTLTNTAPQATNDAVTTTEDTIVSIEILANDSDADLDALSIQSTTQGAHGAVAIDGTHVTYNPEANWSGTDSFAYTVSDGAGGTATATVSVTVTPVNDAPLAANDSATTAEDTAVTVAVLANDSDVEGDALSIQSVTQGTHGIVTIAGTSVNYAPAANWNGTDSFTYTVSDGNGGATTATVSVTVTPVNDVPVAANDTATTAEDTAVSIAVLANDSDVDGDVLSIQSVTQGAHGVVTIAGTSVNYAPAANWNGTDSLTYAVSDGNGGATTATVSVTVTPVNDVPVAANDSATTAEDTAVSIAVLANDSDVDGDALSIQSVTQGTHGVVTIAGTSVNYVPAANWNGTDSFTYTVSDGNGGTAAATVSVTVTPVGDAPIFASNPLNRPDATAGQAYSDSLAGSASDADAGDSVTYSKVDGPAWLSVAANGALSGVPPFEAAGGNVFTVRATDGGGLTADVALQINVAVVNASGVWVNAAGGSWTNSANWGDGVVANGADQTADFSTLDLTADTTITLDVARTIGDLIFDDTTPSHRWILAAGAGGELTLDVASDAPSIAVNNQAVAINVALAGTKGLAKSGSGTLELAANNTYTGLTTVSAGTLAVDGSIEANVTVESAASLTGAGVINGAVSVQSGGGLAPGSAGIGALTINNTLDLAGSVTMEISKSGATLTADQIDGITLVTYGGTLVVTNVGPDVLVAGNRFTLFTAETYAGAFANITLPVLTSGLVWDTSKLAVDGSISVNSLPAAVADTVTTPEDTVASIPVLGNDSDADGDTLSIQSVTQGVNGAVAIAGNNVSYTPATNWNGTDSFSYTIADGRGGTSTATVTVTVSPVNDAPVFTANPISKPGGTIGVAYSGSIASDATDIDAGDSLAFSKVTGPAWLNVAANGSLSGLPPEGSGGVNSFIVRVTDAGGLSADATLNITIVGGLLPGWTGGDIGAVGIAGGASENSGTFTVSGSGADIGGTADAFQFASQTLNGDGEIRARITSQSNTSAWAKAGVMIRESSAANSRHAMIVATPGNGFAFQYRTATGGTSSSVAGPALNAVPNNWVRLTRSGSLITAYVSADGVAWTQVGTAAIAMNASVSAGLAVTSTNNAAISTATFDNVGLTPFPAPWQTADIGATGLQDSAEYYNGAYTVKGAGTVSGSADSFRFVYQTLSGDGEIRARIKAPANTGTNARLGVMIRDTLTSGSEYAFMGVNGSSAYYWQRRSSTGGTTSTTTNGSGTAPNLWVRVVRTGGTLYGYKSSDGVTWTLVTSRNITMGTNIYIGLVDASGSTTTLNTTVFDNVSVTP